EGARRRVRPPVRAAQPARARRRDLERRREPSAGARRRGDPRVPRAARARDHDGQSGARPRRRAVSRELMLLVIDNYDSFTFNLVQYLGELGADVVVRRNDAVTTDDIAAMAPARIVVSPGPCTPNEAGVSLALVERFAGRIPILGVCLGHQAIGQAFGARIVHARAVMHGKTSTVRHDGRGVFAGLPQEFTATRYHSLVIAPDSVP